MNNITKKQYDILTAHAALFHAMTWKGNSRHTKGQLWGYMTILLETMNLPNDDDRNGTLKALIRQFDSMIKSGCWPKVLVGMLIMVSLLCSQALEDQSETKEEQPCN